MPLYEWTGDGEFRENRNGETVAPGDIVELDAHAGEPNDELVRVGEAEEQMDADESGGEEANEDICGYEKDDGTLCQRNAGWGRDADSGRCSDHLEE